MIYVLLFIVVVAAGGSFAQPYVQRAARRTPGAQPERVAGFSAVAEVPPIRPAGDEAVRDA